MSCRHAKVKRKKKLSPEHHSKVKRLWNPVLQLHGTVFGGCHVVLRNFIESSQLFLHQTKSYLFPPNPEKLEFDAVTFLIYVY